MSTRWHPAIAFIHYSTTHRPSYFANEVVPDAKKWLKIKLNQKELKEVNNIFGSYILMKLHDASVFLPEISGMLVYIVVATTKSQ